MRAAAIIVRDSTVLLVRHEKEGKTYWLLPGGGVDKGEPVAESLKRELREEANLEIEVGNLVFANDSISPSQDRHIINLYFTATITGGQLKTGEDPRVAEVAFMPFDELATLTFYPDIRDALVPALHEGFKQSARYLGNLWKDN